MIHFFCEGHEVTRQYLGIKLLTRLFLIDRRGSPTVVASVISVLISDLMYELQRTSRHLHSNFVGSNSPPTLDRRFTERSPVGLEEVGRMFSSIPNSSIDLACSL